ncbi:hypothetical protein FRC12_008831 [Ceratobasidium sp. 428]|nr:hypothetical protein FRC12_008831 [Ceratobasidium sp. 428]
MQSHDAGAPRSKRSSALNWFTDVCSPPRDFDLDHPPPKNRAFLYAALIISLIGLPVLVLVNCEYLIHTADNRSPGNWWLPPVATQGFELVSTLQPTTVPNDTNLERWWGMKAIPSLLRPQTPECEPKDLGAGDTFRLSASLFDYTVMSVWDNNDPLTANGVRAQKRVEYRAQSFADCHVNTTQFDYNRVGQTMTVTVGIICPGTNKSYPVYVGMKTKVVFGWTPYAYVDPYRLVLTESKLTRYQDLVKTVFDVISTDAMAIFMGNHTSELPLSMGCFLNVNPILGSLDGADEQDLFTYLNGTAQWWPLEADIYDASIANLMRVVNHAVNLDLGNSKTPNMFRDSSIFSLFLDPNRPPKGVLSSQWVGGDSWTSGIFRKLPSEYGSWAHALLNGKPFQVGDATGLPSDSVMVTNYLCPTYRLKQTGPLVTSIIIGVVSMGGTAWGIMMGIFVLILLLKTSEAPKVQCICNGCKTRMMESEMMEQGEIPQLRHPPEMVERLQRPEQEVAIQDSSNEKAMSDIPELTAKTRHCHSNASGSTDDDK